MVSAVSNNGGINHNGAGAGPADGQAQLQRLQHQLADNVNCASANTLEGKATIAAIQEKISALKHQIQDPPAPAAVPAAARVGSTSGGVVEVYAWHGQGASAPSTCGSVRRLPRKSYSYSSP